MFHHRVLPPPLALAASSIGTAPSTYSDIFLNHKSMINSRLHGNLEVFEPPRSSQGSPSPTKQQQLSSPVQMSLQDHHDSEPGPDAIDRLSYKRSSSDVSLEETSSSRAPLPDLRITHSPSQICLCQPNPKVPRPRNAFILYRQHHQGSIVASNPGLANPEISKIIGEEWRSLPSETKDHWKLLAEEEKLRHQRQYPDYRYQPRRSGRSSVPALGGLNPSESPRCAKCGGRSITLPFMSPPSLGTPSLSTPSTPISLHRTALVIGTPPSGTGTSRFVRMVESPPVLSPVSQIAAFQSQNSAPRIKEHVGLGLSQDRRFEGSVMPSNADISKRRRMDNGLSTPTRNDNGPKSPFPFSRNQTTLPRPDFMQSSKLMISPPPRPQQRVNISRDNPVTLPPLRTGSMVETSTQAKSVEAMVMSISPLNKIKVLAKICPPLPIPGPTSPPHETRGVLVAIDGLGASGGISDSSINEVVSYLRSSLAKDNDYQIHVFDTPFESTTKTGTFAEYLQLINYWHSISDKITKFITTQPMPPSPPPISPKTVLSPTTGMTRKNSELFRSDSKSGGIDDNAMDIDKPLLSPALYSTPIALVPHYQLSLTDVATCTIPIRDSYAPIDHWQWMATLWRGIIGPDITIVVQSNNTNQTDSGGPNGMAGSPVMEGSRGGVKIRLSDARAVVLEIDDEGKLGESALRRMRFEIGEWVRGLKRRKGS